LGWIFFKELCVIVNFVQKKINLAINFMMCIDINDTTWTRQKLN
jgi:hypothetical protein